MFSYYVYCLLSPPPPELFSRILGMRMLWGRTQGFCRIWNGTTPYVLLSKPSVVEVSLSLFPPLVSNL